MEGTVRRRTSPCLQALHQHTVGGQGFSDRAQLNDHRCHATSRSKSQIAVLPAGRVGVCKVPFPSVLVTPAHAVHLPNSVKESTMQPALASAPNSKAFWGEQALVVLTQCYHWPSSRASWEPKVQHTGGMSHRNIESLPPSVRLQNQPRPGPSTCTRGETGRPCTWVVGWGRPLQRHAHTFTRMHTCTRVHTQCSCTTWAVGWGLYRDMHTCTHMHICHMHMHAHVHVCTHSAHVRALIQAHGHGHTIYMCPHRPAEAQEEAGSEPALPGLR